MIRKRFWIPMILAGFSTLALPGWAAEVVIESARDIPVAYEVDVVVVGGSTGAVQAAVTAATEGAKVFLAAPFPYLGEDMTATLRLWLEKGEQPGSPLARRLFNDESREAADPSCLPLTYETDIPSVDPHKDTNPPTRLTDRRWQSASQQSVQFNQDTTIIADLGSRQDVRNVRVTFFRRRDAGGTGIGFDVGRVSVQTSDDKKSWKPLGTNKNDLPFQDLGRLSFPTSLKTRYVKLKLELPKGYGRMLLGELEILGPQPAQATGYHPILPPRPMHIKKTLDDALLRGGVQFLYSCFATDLLYDESGRIAGIVMANRAGRQAILARTVIDATPRAIVARLAGARFHPYPKGVHVFRRVVIGGEPRDGEQVKARIAAPPFTSIYPSSAKSADGDFKVIEYTLSLPIENASYAAYMKADQQARTLTYHPDQQFTSDILFEVPPDPVHGRQQATGSWESVAQLPLEAFRPEKIDRLWILGGCADISRQQAEKLLRPLALIDLGARLGKAAAAEALSVSKPEKVRLPGNKTVSTAPRGDVREALAGVRPIGRSPTTIPQQARTLPVLGSFDVVVIGGGTGGAPAGIGAARQGARTLVVEYLHGLGGVGTQGAISSYYWGNRIGFTATVLDGATKWPIEPKMEWYRKQLLDADAAIWFGTIGCGAFVEDNVVKGAVVATPHGRGVVLAKTVIDATGNSDIAAPAGAQCNYTNATEFGMQGTGLPGRRLGGSYNNTDFTIVDETDLLDIWRVFVYSKDKYSDAFDHGRLIDTRERRRIVGDVTISILDELNQRTYPDSVEQAYSNFDTHGYTIDPYFLLEHPKKKGVYVYIPFRAMLPKGLEGIVVTGLSISAHRDALPLIRMQADIQNGGYAAGVGAAMATKKGVAIRHIDVKRLQQHLIKIGNLPESVLTDKDSYPLPDQRIADAVQRLKDGGGASVIMADPERSVPLLQQAFQTAADKDKLTYAKALAVLGQTDGVELLLDTVRQIPEWDKGWNYKGMGQFGAALSPLDEMTICLGRTGAPHVIPVILDKVALLDARGDFSHHRAVGLALELLGDKRAAEPLARLLAKAGMTGHVQVDLKTAKEQGVPGGTTAERPRRRSLRELLLARALFRCGDYQDVGRKILQAYTHDLRGHLARHAQAILDAGPEK